MLKDAGCYLVMFGIESGDVELRRNILKKNITDDQIRNAARLFRQYDVRMKTFNIMGLPDRDG